mgnify:CR=1 FL=1
MDCLETFSLMIECANPDCDETWDISDNPSQYCRTSCALADIYNLRSYIYEELSPSTSPEPPMKKRKTVTFKMDLTDEKIVTTCYPAVADEWKALTLVDKHTGCALYKKYKDVKKRYKMSPMYNNLRPHASKKMMADAIVSVGAM